MSDEFSYDPWGDNTPGASNNAWQQSNDPLNEASASGTSSEPVRPRGNRQAVADLPPAIRNQLNPHWSAWTLLSPEEARYLTANERTRFFTLNRRGRWEATRGRVAGTTERWVCLEKVPSNPNRTARSGSGSTAAPAGDRPSANQQEAEAIQTYQPEGTRTDHDLHLSYLDDQGEPVADIQYTVTLQNQEYRGRLNEQGEATLYNLPAGEATILYQADHSRLPQLRRELATLLDNIINERSDRKQIMDDLLAESNYLEQGLILTGAFMVSLWDSTKDLASTTVDIVTGTADTLASASSALYSKLADGYSLEELEDDFAYVVTEAGHAMDQAQKAYTVLKWLATDEETWDLLVSFPKRFFESMSTVEKVEALGALAFDILFAIALAVATALTAGAAAAVAGSAAAIKYSRYFTDCIGTLRRIYHLLPTGIIERRYDQVRLQSPEQNHTGQSSIPTATLARPNETDTHSQSTTETDESTLCEANSTTCGDPINMLTGEELFSQVDFELGGPLPLVWKRLYRSTASARKGDLGFGWSHPFDQSLTLKDGELVHRDAEGASIRFPLPADRQRWRNQNGTVISRFGDALSLRQAGVVHHFEPDPQQPDRWRLSQLSTPDRTHRWALHHDDTDSGLGRLIRATASWGARLHFHTGRHGWHRISGRAHEHAPERTLAHYRLDQTGDLIAARNHSGQVEHYRYHHHLFQLRCTATGLTFRFEWDGTGPTARCTRQYADSGDYDYRFEWHPEQRTSTSTDGRGYTETFVFDTEGHLTQRTRPDGSVECWEYNSRSQLQAHTDPLGNATRFEYDARDRLVKRTDALGHDVRLHYWSDSQQPSQIIDPLGRRTQYDYNSEGHLTALRHPDGTEERWAYAGDHLIAHRDPQGRENRYLWDERSGQLARHLCLVTDAREGETAPLLPDDWNRLPEERAAYLLADPRITTIADTRFDYDDQGRLHTRIDQNGQQQHFQYDDNGRLITQLNEHNQAWRYDYDTAGRLIGQTDPGGRTTQLRYGPFAQPEAKILPNGQEIRYQYDTERNLTAVINGNGQAHRFEYDGCERLTREIGVDGRTTDYHYNDAGHLIGLSEGPITATFERNALGQLIREHYQHADRQDATTWTEYHYSATGQLIKARNEHADHQFEYDAAGRLTLDHIGQDFPAWTNQVRTYSHRQQLYYNAQGQLSNVHHSATVAKLSGQKWPTLHDDFTQPGWQQSYNWHLDGTLKRIGVSLPDQPQRWGEPDTPLLEQRLNKLGQVTERHQGAHQLLWDYDPEQRLSRYRRIKATDADRPTQDPTEALHNPTPTALQDRRYGFDEHGRINRIDDQHRGQRRFAYDPIDQLTQVEEQLLGNSTRTVHKEQTDPAGNRLPEGLDTLPDNRLPFHGDRHFDYDEHGNLVRIQRGTNKKLEQRLSYNAKHQLICIEDYKNGDLQQRLSFRYDALGRRIDKAVQGWVTPEPEQPINPYSRHQPEKKPEPAEFKLRYREAYVWQAQTLIQVRHIGTDFKPKNNRVYFYEPGTHVPVALWDENLGLHDVDCDHAGTPKALYSRETGEEVWSSDHEIYGKTIDTKIALTHPVTGLPFDPGLRQQGQYEDVETGLYQNCYRFYDPDVGRYINQDPIGLLGGLNAYQYTPNPVEWVDPLGLANKECEKNKKTFYQGESRQDAFRQAKRDAGIPMSQEPYRVLRPNLEDGYDNRIIDKNGIPVTFREYYYVNSDGTHVAIQEHSLGHQKATPNRGVEPHFNVRPIDNLNTGSFPGTHGHYNF
ncbi:DUF6531 domain-containing protein [Saccharospirillum alexandrii]|uniref:DUF6531 domain-containing protein n=1 Tax=Saccharospirillum alexandrii TaxID=2448477 RepID=UPI000FDB351F|nr:DUF6531 domain-containing protein [Saccharospirillum alexandrii]